MANLIDETENVVILALLLAIVGLAIWAAFKVRNVFGPAPDGTSLSDALKGWWNDFFGGDDDEEDTSTLAEQQAALASFTMPQPQEASADLVESAGDWTNWLQTAQTDPGKLYLGNSPLF